MLIAFSFMVFYFSGTSVIGIIFRDIFIDGLQGVHISNQTRVYSIMRKQETV
jgi:hypothetical protein